MLYAPKRQNTKEVLGPCPECKRIHRRLYTPHIVKNNIKLYFVYIPKIKMYKLGITSQEKISKRMYSLPIEILWEYPIGYSKGREIEKYLHNYFKEYRYKDSFKKVIKDGNTELYTKNILPNINVLCDLLAKANI